MKSIIQACREIELGIAFLIGAAAIAALQPYGPFEGAGAQAAAGETGAGDRCLTGSGGIMSQLRDCDETR